MVKAAGQRLTVFLAASLPYCGSINCHSNCCVVFEN